MFAKAGRKNPFYICILPWVIISQHRDLQPVDGYLCLAPGPAPVYVQVCRCYLYGSCTFETKWWNHSWICIILWFRNIRMLIKCWMFSLFTHFEVLWILVILYLSTGKIKEACLPRPYLSQKKNVVDLFPLNVELFKLEFAAVILSACLTCRFRRCTWMQYRDSYCVLSHSLV